MGRPKKEKPKRADQRYEKKITIGRDMFGKIIRKSFYSTTSQKDADAKAAAYQFKMQATSPAGNVLRSVTFEQWADFWLNHYIKGSVSNGTFSSNYEIPLRLHLVPYFRGKHLSEITPLMLQMYLDKKLEELSRGSVAKHRICLNQMFTTAIENHYLAENPLTSNVKIKRDNRKKKEKRFYTVPQQQYIIDFALQHPKGLPIILMLLTGVSKSELLALSFDDLTDRDTLLIRKGVTSTRNPDTGKTEVVVSEKLKTLYRARELPISHELAELIRKEPRTITIGGGPFSKIPKQTLPRQYIVCSNKGGVQTPSNFYHYYYLPFFQDLKAHAEKEGIDLPILTPHELRHTAATTWGNMGMFDYHIMHAGGWSDLKMVSTVYGHADVESLRSSMIKNPVKLSSERRQNQ